MQVTALYTYPLKSGKAIPSDRLLINEWGPAGDRRLMLVDETGKFVTGRKFPRLVLVGCDVQGQHIRLSAPNMPVLELTVPSGGNASSVVVWRDEVAALSVGSEADRWFSEYLQHPVRLVYMPDSSFRQVDREYYDHEQRVGFADGYPFLAVTEESLADLNGKLSNPIQIGRFRPNIVLGGALPWEEDGWNHLKIGAVEFKAVKPCSRCVFTTIDPENGEKGKEPLMTLAGFRKTADGVIFGQNLVQLGEGEIYVGDEVVLL